MKKTKLVMNEDIYDALYKDVVCKSYCSVEVPDAVRMLMNEGMNFTDALRWIMIGRINHYWTLGELKCTEEQKDFVINDLGKSSSNRSKNYSRNLKGIRDKVIKSPAFGMYETINFNASFYGNEIELGNNIKEMIYANGLKPSKLIKQLIINWYNEQKTKAGELTNGKNKKR